MSAQFVDYILPSSVAFLLIANRTSDARSASSRGGRISRAEAEHWLVCLSTFKCNWRKALIWLARQKVEALFCSFESV
jgi:hypothetical protein